MLEALERLGYKAHLFEAPAVHEDKEMGRLIRASVGTRRGPGV